LLPKKEEKKKAKHFLSLN